MNSSNESSLRGWQKWLLISVVTLVCSGIVVYFNFRVFDFYDAIPYVGVVLFLVLLSLITTLHIKRAVVVTRFLVAAFILEIALMGVLGVNATYSLYVMRKMSVATQAETSRNESLNAASKFKGRRAQGRALKVVETATPVQSKQQVFDEYEGVLFWILAAEIGIGAIGMVILMALSFFGAFAVVTPAAPTPQIQTQTVVPTPAPQVHSPAPIPAAAAPSSENTLAAETTKKPSPVGVAARDRQEFPVFLEENEEKQKKHRDSATFSLNTQGDSASGVLKSGAEQNTPAKDEGEALETDYGFDLPPIAGCRWRHNGAGFDLNMQENGKRGKYIGHLSKTLLAKFARETDASAAAGDWARGKLAEKGIEQ